MIRLKWFTHSLLHASKYSFIYLIIHLPIYSITNSISHLLRNHTHTKPVTTTNTIIALATGGGQHIRLVSVSSWAPFERLEGLWRTHAWLGLLRFGSSRLQGSHAVGLLLYPHRPGTPIECHSLNASVWF